MRISTFDLLLAAISPLLALYLRDAYILRGEDWNLLVGYCAVSAACSIAAFAIFGIWGSIPRYFAVNDLIDVGKAVLTGELMTCVALFSFTRLEGIPRSTPAIHALILGAGLIIVRALSHVADRKRQGLDRAVPRDDEHVILIGLTDLAVLYMKLIEAAGGRQSVIALLDDEPRWFGRSVNGVRVLGMSSELETLIEEFAVHGIRTDRIVVSGQGGALSEAGLREIRRVCAKRDLQCLSLAQLLGLELSEPAAISRDAIAAVQTEPPANNEFLPSRYFRVRRLLDLGCAFALLMAAMPLWILVCVLAFLDVGSPIFFWQQRVGINGRSFLLYKLRTLPSRNWITGEPSPSVIGRLLRRTRLDEFPQLLNVLVGDMSLIGPRPLLPHDQPANPTMRLMVRPGITGWAQVHGGALLSADEKEALDELYVRGASPSLDLRILVMTLATLIRGDRRSDKLLARARAAAEARHSKQIPLFRSDDAPAAAAASQGESEASIVAAS